MDPAPLPAGDAVWEAHGAKQVSSSRGWDVEAFLRSLRDGGAEDRKVEWADKAVEAPYTKMHPVATAGLFFS